MYVYQTITQCDVENEIVVSYLVGYFKPDGTFERDHAYSSKAEAAERVNFLNGGSGNYMGCDSISIRPSSFDQKRFLEVLHSIESELNEIAIK